MAVRAGGNAYPGLVGCRKQHKSTRYPLVDGSASGSVGGGWPELILRTSGALFGGMDAAGRFEIVGQVSECLVSGFVKPAAAHQTLRHPVP